MEVCDEGAEGRTTGNSRFGGKMEEVVNCDNVGQDGTGGGESHAVAWETERETGNLPVGVKMKRPGGALYGWTQRRCQRANLDDCASRR